MIRFNLVKFNTLLHNCFYGGGGFDRRGLWLAGFPSARSAAGVLMRNPKRVESIPANAALSRFPWWWN